jgi:hypothetical protein
METNILHTSNWAPGCRGKSLTGFVRLGLLRDSTASKWSAVYGSGFVLRFWGIWVRKCRVHTFPVAKQKMRSTCSRSLNFGFLLIVTDVPLESIAADTMRPDNLKWKSNVLGMKQPRFQSRIF